MRYEVMINSKLGKRKTGQVRMQSSDLPNARMWAEIYQDRFDGVGIYDTQKRFGCRSNLASRPHSKNF